MAGVKVKVEGLKALDRALSELPKATAKAVLRRTAIKALKPFDDAWRANAPRLTGALEESGGIGTKLTTRQTRLNRKRQGKSFVEVFAGPNDPAAIQDEFGNSNQAATPFVRPAWDATKNRTLEIVKDELAGEIDKAANRLASRAARKAARGGA